MAHQQNLPANEMIQPSLFLYPHQRWEEIKALLEQQIERTTYRIWLLASKGVALDGITLTVEVPYRFGRGDWFRNHLAQIAQHHCDYNIKFKEADT